MKKLYAIAMLFCLAASAAAQVPADDLLAGSTPIAGDELKARLSGKSFTWKPVNLPISALVKYDDNGFVFINLSNGQNDSGRWRMEGGKVCVEWRHLASGCAPEARTKGDLVLMQRADGTWATMTLK